MSTLGPEMYMWSSSHQKKLLPEKFVALNKNSKFLIKKKEKIIHYYLKKLLSVVPSEERGGNTGT